MFRPVQMRKLSGLRVVLVPAIALVGAVMLGMGSVWLRRYCKIGHLHLEGLGALVLLVLASIVLMLLHRRHSTFAALAALDVELAALWAGYIVGFSIAYGRVWDDVVIVFGGWGAGAALILSVGSLLMHWMWPPRLASGPYCRQCGYLLIGLIEHRCPECGKPFTLEELGIAAEDLLPPARPKTAPEGGLLARRFPLVCWPGRDGHGLR